MVRKKITVVNIDDNDNKNDEVIDVTETIQEPIEIPQEVIEKIETVQESPKDMDISPVDDTPETHTKTQSQEVIKCLKCDKLVTKTH